MTASRPVRQSLRKLLPEKSEPVGWPAIDARPLRTSAESHGVARTKERSRST